jgi:predicted secreted hydrolase
MRALAILALVAAASAPAADTVYPPVTPAYQLRFPRDHGAHPAFRTEWWYFTGWLETAEGRPLGFQITFFRSRPRTDPANPSAFAPKQILFAHAALSDPERRRLVHDQRIARAGFGLAEAAERDAEVKLLDWSLSRRRDGTFAARAFGMDLAFAPTQKVMVNGEGGYSRKGPRPAQASHYYSIPHLAVSGTVVRNGRRVPVTGRAWLDREWSSTLLDPAAAGWDWTAIHFDDGGAWMAFRVRGKDGRALYAGGTWRRRDGRQTVLGPADVRFVPRRRWRSPATGAVYPVEADFLIRLPEGERRFSLRPLFNAQELDGRAHGMPAYWEGAVTTPGGRGYLELTGYAEDLKL